MELTDAEQQMEYELVAAMYPDVVSEPAPSAVPKHDGAPSYTVGIAAEAGGPIELRLDFIMPEGYPNEAAPVFRVESVSTTRRINGEGLVGQLNALVEEQGLGMAAMPVLQKCQEHLLELDQAVNAQNAAAAEAAVVEDPTIHLGISVTPEVWAEWRARFRAEKAALLASKAKKVKATTASKLTGRQMWDQTIKEADWGLFEGADGADDGEDVDYDQFAVDDEAEADA